MKSRHVPMSFEEFELLPVEPGWKSEYRDGKAHVTPSEHVAFARVTVSPAPVNSPLPMNGVTPEDQGVLLTCFATAFQDTIEYCDSDPAHTSDSGRKLMREYFGGKRGSALQASKMAWFHPRQGGDRQVAGAALIVGHKDNSALLDLLFVHPDYRGQGLASALVQGAINHLAHLGKDPLFSRYHLGNLPSRTWHQRFGFVEEPDLILARLYLATAQHNYLRARQLGNLPDFEANSLLKQCEYWNDQVQSLEESLVNGKMEEAFALWRHQD